jgi:hypothetical protein
VSSDVVCVQCQLAAPALEWNEHARNIPSAVCVAPREDEQVMLERCRRPLILNKLNKNCITLVSLY